MVKKQRRRRENLRRRKGRMESECFLRARGRCLVGLLGKTELLQSQFHHLWFKAEVVGNDACHVGSVASCLPRYRATELVVQVVYCGYYALWKARENESCHGMTSKPH